MGAPQLGAGGQGRRRSSIRSIPSDRSIVRQDLARHTLRLSGCQLACCRPPGSQTARFCHAAIHPPRTTLFGISAVAAAPCGISAGGLSSGWFPSSAALAFGNPAAGSAAGRDPDRWERPWPGFRRAGLLLVGYSNCGQAAGATASSRVQHLRAARASDRAPVCTAPAASPAWSACRRPPQSCASRYRRWLRPTTSSRFISTQRCSMGRTGRVTTTGSRTR